ncbi:myeloid leukemia factor 1 isoform X1 [Stegostoma tigrinum]|uniref:myeloid leukemia factor 1 isoform X1 n=1 Tax=Stegostoma tigrinum TaxID=3053191 RepID=UPI00287027A9|nr:myeloid leukemia factor 1 isoform X1 [Stegostoma tigrinum]
MFREIEEDPFFSEPFRFHHEHLRKMMGHVPNFIRQDFVPNSQPGCSSQSATRNEAPSWTDPFNRMSAMMEQIRKEMFDMQNTSGIQPSDRIGHSLNSSSVMTYAKVGNEPPKIFQATNHVHQVPGGIKETRRAVKDSESGIEKMSIGHHIQDRAHVIQKSRNQKTGQEEVDQQFINLNETDAANFDQEWLNKVSKYMPSGTCPSSIQAAGKTKEGQSTACAKGPTCPLPVAPSGGCGCPAKNSSQRNCGGQHAMKHGRK